MKTYSIGRENGCDIIINDNTDVISRRHADLSVSAFGKMTIVDHSSNGTYVNGIRITSGEAVPVSRKDSISFAHVAQLDWDRVPRSKTIPIILCACAALLLVLGVIGYLLQEPQDFSSALPPANDAALISAERQQQERDSLVKVQQDSINKVRQDSIEKVRKDSIEKFRNDSIEKARKSGSKKVKKEQKTEKEDSETQTTSPRAVG